MFNHTLPMQHTVAPFSLQQPQHFMFGLGMRDCVEIAHSMIRIRAPGALINGKYFIFANGEHNAVGSMSHAFDSISEVIVSSIGNMFLVDDFALQLEVTNEWKFLKVHIIFQKNIVLDLHRLKIYSINIPLFYKK